MKLKKIVGASLGLFVLFSIGYYAVTELRKIENSARGPDTLIVSKEGKEVNALYFHGENRCYTCNLMEGYIRDVLKESFAKEMESHLLTFESINIDRPEKRHYIQDYQLQSISFFISIKNNGKELKFKNIDQIWKLAQNELAFKKYIKEEITKYLES